MVERSSGLRMGMLAVLMKGFCAATVTNFRKKNFRRKFEWFYVNQLEFNVNELRDIVFHPTQSMLGDLHVGEIPTLLTVNG
jgi:hypothetical protein